MHQKELAVPVCTTGCMVHHTTVTPGMFTGESPNNGTVTIILPTGSTFADILVKDEHGNQVRLHLDYEAAMSLMLRLGHAAALM